VITEGATKSGDGISGSLTCETVLPAMDRYHVGVAPNKSLAKIASDLKKPDALVVVEPEEVQDFLDPLPVERLWGVGKKSSKVFERLGIRTIGQLRQCPVDVLQGHFGSSGECLWQLAHGIDDRTVVPEREAKSISHETTFEQDIDDLEVLRAWLLDLTFATRCNHARNTGTFEAN
jgi:DNA polymerase IV